MVKRSRGTTVLRWTRLERPSATDRLGSVLERLIGLAHDSGHERDRLLPLGHEILQFQHSDLGAAPDVVRKIADGVDCAFPLLVRRWLGQTQAVGGRSCKLGSLAVFLSYLGGRGLDAVPVSVDHLLAFLCELNRNWIVLPQLADRFVEGVDARFHLLRSRRTLRAARLEGALHRLNGGALPELELLRGHLPFYLAVHRPALHLALGEPRIGRHGGHRGSGVYALNWGARIDSGWG